MDKQSNQGLWIGVGVTAALGLIFAIAGLVVVQALSAGRAVTEGQRARETAASLPRAAAAAVVEADEGAARELEAAARDQPAGSQAAATVLASIQELLRRAETARAEGKAEGARALLSAAVDSLESSSTALDPFARSALRAEAARVYENLGDREPATELFARALADLRPMLGEHHPEIRRLRSALERLKQPPAPAGGP
ncbi:MAG: hypothetical protein AB7K52_02120 [Phycisphaerales bacterium]